MFFRAQISSRFARITGDNGDARLAVYLCEHWYLWFSGHGSWRSPAFFYPLKGLLGWSDSYLLYEVFYAPLRVAGCDPFLAFQLTLVLLSAVGFTSFLLLVRRAFGAPQGVALLGALVFTFSNTMWLHVGSPQLSGVYIVPLILLLGMSAWRLGRQHPVRSALLGALAGLLWALLLYTTYYVAWFFALAAGVATVLWFLSGPRLFLAAGLSALRASAHTFVAAVVGFGVGIVPFALTYLPVLHEFGGLRYGEAMDYAPHVRSALVDVGTGNALWSGLSRRLVGPRYLTPYELQFAVTPVLLLLAVAGGIVVGWRVATGRAARPGVARSVAVLAGTALVLIVLPMREGRHSLWRIVWEIPGARAIRAIDRLEVLTGFAVALAVVGAATELSARRGAHGPRRPRLLWRCAGVGLLLLAVAEQFNTKEHSTISRPAQLALLRTPPPPRVCRSFFVVDHRHTVGYVDQIDAMLISQKLSIPTINGYTAHDPRDWELRTPSAPGYRRAVAAWVTAHRIGAGLCQLDLAPIAWVTSPDLPSAASGPGIHVGLERTRQA